MSGRRRGHVAAGAAALAGAALLGGCSVSIGGDDSLDIPKLEQNIADGTEDERGFRPVVECPEDVEAREGDEFTCTATAPDGTTATVFVTQTDDEGNVRWRLVVDGTTTTG